MTLIIPPDCKTQFNDQSGSAEALFLFFVFIMFFVLMFSVFTKGSSLNVHIFGSERVEKAIESNDIKALRAIAINSKNSTIERELAIRGISTVVLNPSIPKASSEEGLNVLVSLMKNSEFAESASNAVLMSIKPRLKTAEALFYSKCSQIVGSSTSISAYRLEGPRLWLINGKFPDWLADEMFYGAVPTEVDHMINKVSSVVCIKQNEEVVGKYEPSGANALVIHYTVFLIDLTRMLVSASSEFVGSPPPSKSLRGPASGSPPSKEIIDQWLNTLPVKN